MKVKLLHVYYDIMNLYGENGNIKMLERRLKDQGVEVETDRLTITDEIDFEKYDFIYCGCGMESYRNACLKHLFKYKDSLKRAYDSGKVMLFTGNAYEMLGEKVTDPEGNEIEGAHLFDFTTTEERKKRYSGDVVVKSKLFEKPLVGFINSCSETCGITEPLFEIEREIGSVTDKFDGLHSNNLFGTLLIGPIMVKNPHFAEYIVKMLVDDYKDIRYKYADNGYEITLTELMKDSNNYV